MSQRRRELMALYYFDVRTGVSAIPDDRGSECGTLEAAVAQAGLIRDALLAKNGVGGAGQILEIEIRNEFGRRVSCVPEPAPLREPAGVAWSD